MLASALIGTLAGREGKLGLDVGTGGLPTISVAVEVGENLRVEVTGPGARGHEAEAAQADLMDELGLSPEALALVWAGEGVETPTELLEWGADLLADLDGGEALRGASRRLMAAEGGMGEPDPLDLRELAELGGRIEALSGIPTELTRLEEGLRELRADAAELAGDLEEATMEWLRERQDAETHLFAYRDRARELKVRLEQLEKAGADSPCPTCGRPLADHHDDVRVQLDEEWEAIVQDGKWWRRRRDQLELKPGRLRELESKTFRLQAEVEGASEKVERCRFGLRDLDELRAREREILLRVREATPEGGIEGGLSSAERRAITLALEDLRVELVERALLRLQAVGGYWLNRVSSGGFLGLEINEGSVRAFGGPAGGEGVAEEVAEVMVALRLALLDLVNGRGVGPRSLLLDRWFHDLSLAARTRVLLELGRGGLENNRQTLVLMSPGSLCGLESFFDSLLEVRIGADGESSVHEVRSGAIPVGITGATGAPPA